METKSKQAVTITAPEEELIQLVLKYRDAVNQREYLPIAERESDRVKLNEIYATLDTIRQKILDSKCYSELGKLQKELSEKFLAEDTTPAQRLSMVAYLVRSLAYPVVFAAGRSVLTTIYQQNAVVAEPVADIESDAPGKQSRAKSVFQTRTITPDEIARIQAELRQLFRRPPSLQKLAGLISLEQAQILSQLAANNEIPLRVAAHDGIEGITSIILKESNQ